MKLRDYAREIGIEAGCSDSGCIWGRQSGMCTNGGCCCVLKHGEARRLAIVARHISNLLDKAKS